MRLLPALALVFGGLLLADVFYATAAPRDQQVEVTNFPNPQEVVGAVEVSNLPAVQDVNIVSSSRTGGFDFVGFTAQHVDAVSGFFTLRGVCQAEFGSSSRTCLASEILRGTAVPTGLIGDAWIHNDSGGGGPGLSCSSWSFVCPVGPVAANPKHSTMRADGSISQAFCTVPLENLCTTTLIQKPVACCALVP